MRSFKVINGVIQQFEIPSQMYGLTMTADITLKDALERGFVSAGDGDDYVFTASELQGLQAIEDSSDHFSFLGVETDTKIRVTPDLKIEDYELTTRTGNLLRRTPLPDGEVYVADFLKLEAFTRKVMYELIEHSIVRKVEEPMNVKDIVRKVKFNSMIVLNKIQCKIEFVQDQFGDRIPDMARFIEYRVASNAWNRTINAIVEGDIEEIEKAVYLATDRKIKIIY